MFVTGSKLAASSPFRLKTPEERKQMAPKSRTDESIRVTTHNEFPVSLQQQP